MNLFEQACEEVLETRPHLTGRELKAAAFDHMAEFCEAARRENPKAPSVDVAIHMYREMARQTRAGEIL